MGRGVTSFTVARWRAAVFRDPQLSNASKLLLVYLADYIRADRSVSVPMPRICRDLGVGRSRVAERIGQARERGFLTVRSPGVRGRTAVYEALIVSGPRTQSEGRQAADSARSPDTIASVNRTESAGPLSVTRPGFCPDGGAPVVSNSPAVDRAVTDAAKNGEPVTTDGPSGMLAWQPGGAVAAAVVDYCRGCGGREVLDGERRCADCRSMHARSA